MVRPWSCRVIYYFDTPALGRRHQSFGRVTDSSFNSRKKGTSASSRQNISVKLGGGQTRSRTVALEGSDYQKDIVYPFSTQCEQRHPGNCLVSPG